MDGSDRTDRVSGAKPTAPIRLPRRSAAGEDFLNPILSGQSRVGHKPDPDRPVDTPNDNLEINLAIMENIIIKTSI